MKEQGTWSRRDVVAAFSVGGLGAFVGTRYVDVGKPEQVDFVDEEGFREGFAPVEPDHPIWQDLSRPETRTSIPYKPETIHGQDPFLQTELYFKVEQDDTPLELTMSAAATSNVSARPFIATLDDGQRFMLPFVQSVRPSSVTALLGSLQKGEHALQLNEIPSKFPLGNDVLYPFRLAAVSGTPLQNYLRRTQPRYAIRANNIEDMANDMPLFEVSEVLRQLGGEELLIKKTVIYTSEDGGLSSEEREKRYKRLLDVEPSLQQKVPLKRVVGFPGEEMGFLPLDKQSYQAIIQVHGQKTPHAWATFHGRAKNGQPLIQIKTNNNLLSDDVTERIFFAPPPVYGLGEDTAVRLLQANSEWRIISLHEVDGEVNLERSFPQAGHLAEIQLDGLEKHPMGSYPTTDILLTAS
jgi:hypothetical protein